jgi:hypothetical protein
MVMAAAYPSNSKIGLVDREGSPRNPFHYWTEYNAHAVGLFRKVFIFVCSSGSHLTSCIATTVLYTIHSLNLPNGWLALKSLILSLEFRTGRETVDGVLSAAQG